MNETDRKTHTFRPHFSAAAATLASEPWPVLLR
jgi:hypothetical protein